MSPFENEPTEREYRMAQDEIREQSDAEWRATEKVLKQSAPHSRINAALAAFQSEVGMIAKDGRNDFHRYNYASLEQWVETLRPVLARHGLSIITSCVDVRDLPPLETAKGAALRLVRVCADATLHHVSGEQLSVRAYGEGSDSGDKAVYKAMTGARKYLLAAISGSATSDDPEHERGQEPSGPKRSTGRGDSYKADVRPRDRSQGVEGATPRPVNSPQPNATEHGLPLTDTMLALPYLDETLGFGKHKDVTWRQMCGGGLASGRISYLEWLLKQEIKGERQQATHDKAREVCRLVEEREMSQARAAQDAGDDPAWDAEPRLPGETR